jgi:hypothetical protein
MEKLYGAVSNWYKISFFTYDKTLLIEISYSLSTETDLGIQYIWHNNVTNLIHFHFHKHFIVS